MCNEVVPRSVVALAAISAQSASPDPIRDWVTKAVAGSREYQRRIYERLAPRVYREIRKIVGISHVDDVMQDFVIRLFAKLDQFRFESSLETWAHRMAVNLSLQFLRKVRREQKRSHDLAVVSELVDVPNLPNQTENAEILRFAMARISRDQRALLHMKEVEGLAYEAIADLLGIPIGTVGSRLNKARKELKSSLIQMGYEAA